MGEEGTKRQSWRGEKEKERDQLKYSERDPQQWIETHRVREWSERNKHRGTGRDREKASAKTRGEKCKEPERREHRE